MANRKFKVYCKIIDYVDSVDHELARILRGTCTDMTLGSTKGKAGITFLMPQDKAFRKKIEDLAFSDKVEDADKANLILNSLIFRDVFKSTSDWMSKKDDIPNSLMPSQHVEVESASGKEIVFKSGAKAVIDEDFIDGSRKKNLAVWKLVSGELPITTGKDASLKYSRPGKKGVTGGNQPVDFSSQNERAKIAVAVENTYMLHQLQRTMGRNLIFGGAHQTGGKRTLSVPIEQRPRDIYLEYTLSLLSYILKVWKGPGETLLLDKVLPIISFNKVDFYHLIEPHKPFGSYLLDDNLINEWWVQKEVHTVNMRETMEDLRKLLDRGTGALVYTDRMALISAIGEERMRLLNTINARPRGCIEEICKFYDKLSSDNTINGVGPVYPDGLSEIYRNEPSLKLMQDELRYLTFLQFAKLESDPSFDVNKYREIISIICDYMSAQNGNEREQSIKLLNKNTIRYLISPTHKLQEISIFIKSTCFAYIPLTERELMDSKLKTVIVRPDPSDMKIFNIHGAIAASHKRLLDGSLNQADVNSVVSTIMSLDISKLDPDLRRELENKFRS